MIKKVNVEDWRCGIKNTLESKQFTTFKHSMDLIVEEMQRNIRQITLKRECNKEWVNGKFIALMEERDRAY